MERYEVTLKSFEGSIVTFGIYDDENKTNNVVYINCNNYESDLDLEVTSDIVIAKVLPETIKFGKSLERVHYIYTNFGMLYFYDSCIVDMIDK